MIFLKTFSDPSLTLILSEAYNLSDIEIAFILLFSFFLILISEPNYRKYTSSIGANNSDSLIISKHSFLTRVTVMFFAIILVITPIFILLKTSYFI